METINIAGKNYPIHYNMASFRHILTDLKTDLQGLAEKAGSANMAEVFDFMLTVALHGLRTAAIKNEDLPPFKTTEELAMKVDKLEQLSPALTIYTKAWNEFLGVNEAAEGNEQQPEAEAPAKKKR